MPLYEYAPVLAENEKAQSCCYFETLQSFSENPLKACPTCGHTIVRILSGFSVGNGSSAPKGPSPSSQTTSSDSSASRASRLAMKHRCGPGCSH